MVVFQDLTREELEALLLPLSDAHADDKRKQAQARYRAKQIFHWVYQRHANAWSDMSDLSKALRAWLTENVTLYRLDIKVSQTALDGTHKVLWNLPDGKTIESVVIPAALQEKSEDAEGQRFSGRKQDEDLQSEHWKRLTACISSQVGCAMACKFCLTGVQGLDRHLKTHEIVAQVHELRRLAPLTNVVFMGMGEPLHNAENVMRACKILIDGDGLGFSKRKVTVSTSGLVPAIEELGRTVDVSLAISLNGSNDEQREAIMPVNRRWPLKDLLQACRDYPLGPHRKITFEYVLLKDFNDQLEDAHRVAKLLRGIPCKVNLIPFNEHSGSEFKRPNDETVERFQKVLINAGYVATVRISRGRDILAACGQLRSLFGTARGTDRHRDAPQAQI